MWNLEKHAVEFVVMKGDVMERLTFSLSKFKG